MSGRKPRLVKHTEADLAQAYHEQHFRGWDKLKARATQIAAERALKANSAKTDRLIAESETIDISTREGLTAYLRNADKITAAFAEHDELLDAAFPHVAALEGGAEP
jgi:hypothetical protein